MNIQHPISDELLLDYLEGRLAAPEAERLGARITGDLVATARLAAIRNLVALMRSDTGPDAPEHVIRRAVRLAPRRARRPAPRLITRIAAALQSDSWRTPLAMGLRSEQTQPRNLVYTAGDWTLDLQISPSGGRWQLRGQVLGPEEDGVVELAGVAPAVATVVNGLGEFTLPPVDAGRYRLSLRQSGRVIVVEALELGPSSA